MKTLISLLTGTVAVVAITGVVVIALYYLANTPKGQSELAISLLKGAGTVIGAAIGGLLVLRFKTARRFIRNLFTGEDD